MGHGATGEPILWPAQPVAAFDVLLDALQKNHGEVRNVRAGDGVVVPALEELWA